MSYQIGGLNVWDCIRISLADEQDDYSVTDVMKQFFERKYNLRLLPFYVTLLCCERYHPNPPSRIYCAQLTQTIKEKIAGVITKISEKWWLLKTGTTADLKVSTADSQDSDRLFAMLPFEIIDEIMCVCFMLSFLRDYSTNKRSCSGRMSEIRRESIFQ